MRISTKFYKDLYSTDKVNEKVQDKLLRNVKTKLSKEARTDLDKPITAEEVFKAINKLQSGKSPGLDGFPIEFYKEYWHLIQNLFMAYVNEVLETGISNNQNVHRLLETPGLSKLFDVKIGVGKKTLFLPSLECFHLTSKTA